MDLARVLIAAQDVPLQEVFRDWLCLDGHQITVSGGGRAAIESVKDHGPYDLLVVEAEGRPPGYALIDQLRALGVMTPVILVSSRLLLSETERSRLGVVGVLRKPLPLHELSDAVRAALGGGALMRPRA